MASNKKEQHKPKTAASGRKTQKDPVEDFTREVIIWLILAVSILMFISNLGVGGMVGNAVSDFLFGLFGILSYLFPVFLFMGTAFYISNRRNWLAYKKLAAAACGFLFLCALLQLLTEGYIDAYDLFEFYQTSARYHTGGGIVGGLVCKLCVTAFGIVGAYVLLIICLMISLIILTQRSFLEFFTKLFSQIASGVKASHTKWVEEKPQREEAALLRKEARLQKKAEKALLLEEEPERSQPPAGKQSRRQRRVSEEMPGKQRNILADTKITIPQEEKEEETPAAKEQTSEEAAVLPEDSPVEFEIHRSEEKVLPWDQEPELPDVNEFAEEYDLEDEPEEESEQHPEPAQEPAKRPSRKEAGEAPQKKNPRSSREEIASGIENIKKEMDDTTIEEKVYRFPPVSLLAKGKKGLQGDSDQHLRETAQKLQNTLHNFGVEVKITDACCGPTVTRYELQPEQGVKVSKIVGLADDIKLNLAAADIRIEAPIPGKAAVGIEVPNRETTPVMLRELLQSQEFASSRANIAFAVGKDIAGKPVVADIASMPHLLIAGSTGSGKSVCINTLIMSILFKADPKDVRLIMVDPKVVELSVYNGIPHLLIPVVTDPKKAAGALNWAVAEMTDRYNTFSQYHVRSIKDYNAKIEKMTFGEGEKVPEKMPQIVIIVDELADLMMVAPGEVEDAIVRLTQLARAAGIHLVIATQRPSVNVITGLIKANMPSRIAFAVSSGVDSRTILDMNGAEKLLGKGDMLFYPQGYPKPVRLQGAFVSDQEVGDVVDFLADKNEKPSYNQEIEQKIVSASASHGGSGPDEQDAYFVDAGRFIIEKDKASIGMLQRMFKIGFNRAARIMDQLAAAGVVGPEEGTKPRKILMTQEEFETYIEESL